MPAVVERGAVAGLAPPRRLEVGAAGEEPDPAMAEPDQVLGDRRRAPSKFCESIVGSAEPPTCGSTATTGWLAATSIDRRA